MTGTLALLDKPAVAPCDVVLGTDNIRGTANYWAMPRSNCGNPHRSLDRWTRMRLRCMKFKRKSKADNTRLRLKDFKDLVLLAPNNLRPSGVTR